MITIGNRVFTKVNRPDPALIEAFRGLPSSNINDEMNRLFCMHDYMKLLNRNKARQLLGTAITVKAPIGDNLFFHQALDMAQPGDIIVGDPDGVVVIRPEFAKEALEAVTDKFASEQKTLANYAAGKAPDRSKHIALYEKTVVDNGCLVFDSEWH